MEARVQEGLRRERLLAILGSAFGGVALLLVAIGLYGLLAGAVAHRTREIGIRLALGSRRQAILAMFLRTGLLLVAFGLLAGVGLAIVLCRRLEADLAGVTPTDPATFGVAVGVLTATAGLACLIPAVRATRVNPMTALRDD